jgi:hypothetical protein
MKQTIPLFLISIGGFLIAYDCSISIEPCWANIEQKNTHQEKFGTKWILIGSITFRKKSKEDIKLDSLQLHWQGEKIERLAGSLYKKLPNKQFMAIEENFLCDGIWNSAQQYLTLDFSNHKQTLGPINIFYIVLSVPQQLENILKKGHFELTKSSLPELFSDQANELQLNIAQYFAQQKNNQAQS